MAVRLTAAAKEYLEQVLQEDLKFIRLSIEEVGDSGAMQYVFTWATSIHPKFDIARTACDGNVIVIDRMFEKIFDNVLLGYDAHTPTKIAVLENPNVIVGENGNFRVPSQQTTLSS